MKVVVAKAGGALYIELPPKMMAADVGGLRLVYSDAEGCVVAGAPRTDVVVRTSLAIAQFQNSSEIRVQVST